MPRQHNFDDVVDFTRHFFPDLSSSEDHDLRINVQKMRIAFLQEELDEYREAVNRGDTAAAFDSLLDLVYVAMGTAVLHGFPWQAGWDRVHSANMKKIRVENAGESKRGSKYDCKKPEGWQAPDFDDLVVTHTNLIVMNQHLDVMVKCLKNGLWLAWTHDYVIDAEPAEAYGPSKDDALQNLAEMIEKEASE